MSDDYERATAGKAGLPLGGIKRARHYARPGPHSGVLS